MKKIGMLVICLCLTLGLYIGNVFAAYWVSTDPNDLKPLMGTAWGFQYTYNYLKQTKLIGFSREYIRDQEDGHIMLATTDGEQKGIAEYGDFPGFNFTDPVFICFLTNVDDPSIHKGMFYIFNISSNIAIGKFIYYDTLTPDNFHSSSLIGIKIADLPIDQNQPVTVNPINKDTKSDDNKKYGCFVQFISLILHNRCFKASAISTSLFISRAIR